MNVAEHTPSSPLVPCIPPTFDSNYEEERSLWGSADAKAPEVVVVEREKKKKKVHFGTVTIIPITPREVFTAESSATADSIPSPTGSSPPIFFPPPSAVAAQHHNATFPPSLSSLVDSLGMTQQQGEINAVGQPEEEEGTSCNVFEAGESFSQLSADGRYPSPPITPREDLSLPFVASTPERIPIVSCCEPPTSPRAVASNPQGLLGDEKSDLEEQIPRGEDVFCELCHCRNDVAHHDGCNVHVNCALWSPEVYCDPSSGQLKHVMDAVKRGRCIKCVLCRGLGATVGCAVEHCQRSYHFPCAEQSGGRLSLHDFSFLCPKHSSPKKRRRDPQADVSCEEE